MALDPDSIGRQIRVVQEVTPRWALAYAAALGCCDEAYLGDARPGGPTVLPTFCVALEWALAGSAERNALIGLTAEERARAVHAAQDSEFRAPIRLGMRVETVGAVVALYPVSVGACAVMRYETRDLASGTLLVRSHATHLCRGVTLGGGAAAVGEPPAVSASAPDGQHERLAIATGPGLAHTYGECARIWNPIHTEQNAARAAGLAEPILHSTATWALAGIALARHMAGGWIGAMRRLSASFRRPVIPGDTLDLGFRGERAGRATFELLTPRGDTALTDGLVEFAA